jgi:nifR3 family TIM-barrel protein
MKINPLKIGNLVVDNPVMLAPMAGYSTPVFRNICRKLGSSLNFTEMVPIEGIRRRLPQTMVYLDSFPEEHPLAAHIYGTDPRVFADAARIIESLGRFDLIDINCGCPVRKIAGRGAGVALMADPEKIRTIVRSMVEVTSLPIMVKTRLGISENTFNISEVAQAVEEGGASAITIHARFAAQRHSGPVDLEALKQIKTERSIPVIGNGGIKNGQQAVEMIEKTGVDGIMIGQGSIGNPWIFREIRCAWEGTAFNPPSVEERIEVIAEHLRGLYELMEIKNQLRRRQSLHIERLACEAFRGHLGKYLRGMRGVKSLQGNLMQMRTIEEVIASAAEILKPYGEND